MEDQKRAQKAPNGPEIETKKIRLYLQNQSVGLKKVFEPDPNPQNSPYGLIRPRLFVKYQTRPDPVLI